MSAANLIRPELKAMQPYAAAEQVTDTIRLNANESSWQNDADHFRRPLNRYPEIRPAGLRTLLADRFGCRPEQLLVTRGSSEAIDLLIRAFCRAGTDAILTAAPTFSMYEHYAKIQDAAVRSVSLDASDDWSLDTDALLAKCDETTKLVFLCSPNNPTGSSIGTTRIETVLERLAGHSAVVVDEAYIEFSTQSSAVELLARYDNLIVLRTLSKALAYAGTRCGAVIACEPVVRILDAVQAPYALATPVVEQVEDALRGDLAAKAADEVSTTINERTRVAAALSALDSVVRVFPSDANFLLVRFKDAQAALRATRDSGILVRAYGGELKDFLRISIGSRDENSALIGVLTDQAATA